MRTRHTCRFFWYLTVSALIVGGFCLPSLSEEKSSEGVRAGNNQIATIFSSSEKTHKEKMSAAREFNSVTNLQRSRLHKLICNEYGERGDGAYYALTALVSAKDTASVAKIAEALEKCDNRYYALALGILGNEDVMPVLKRVAKHTARDHVRNESHVALRMLGAKTDASPPEPASPGPVKLSLSASQTNVTAGETFALTATFTNTATSAVNVSKGVFRGGGVEVYSCENEYVLPILTSYFEFQPSADSHDSYVEIPTGGKFEIEKECKIGIDEVSYDKWLEMSGFKQRVFVLKDVDGMWGSKFDIGDYKSGRSFEIEIALVYESNLTPQQFRDRFGVEGPLFIKDRLVSNTVRIRVRDNNEEDSGRTKGSTRE